MIVIDREQDKAKWFDYDDDVKFLIKPFPVSARVLRPGSNTSLSDILFQQAMYSLEGWEGIVDVDGNPVKFTEENKEFIFKYSESLVQWICVHSAELNNNIVNIKQKKI
jgi:hypothetical protein